MMALDEKPQYFMKFEIFDESLYQISRHFKPPAGENHEFSSQSSKFWDILHASIVVGWWTNSTISKTAPLAWLKMMWLC